MVFPSIPVYSEPPNWHQQPNEDQANGGGDSRSHQVLPPLPPQVQAPHMGLIRAGSMADGAQVAKIPAPEAALNCPRCESTNTKFCYFNNYSLSQPRHFCKTCRRYWTRGGALRNVPVGGGCRRNKKSGKRSLSRSKSPAGTTSAGGATIHELVGRFPSQPQQEAGSSDRALMASLQNMSRYGNMGQTEQMGFEIGGGGGVDVEQWRLQQQFPLLSGFDSAVSNIQSVEAANLVGVGDDIGARLSNSNSNSNSRVTHHQLPPVKLEALNLTTRSIISPLSVSLSENNINHQQYYSWTDLSGLASSSVTHLF